MRRKMLAIPIKVVEEGRTSVYYEEPKKEQHVALFSVYFQDQKEPKRLSIFSDKDFKQVLSFSLETENSTSRAWVVALLKTINKTDFNEAEPKTLYLVSSKPQTALSKSKYWYQIVGSEDKNIHARQQLFFKMKSHDAGGYCLSRSRWPAFELDDEQAYAATEASTYTCH